MSISDLSLRHLPDLSDASFSFQIPTDSADDLLRADSDDFFGRSQDILGSPSSLRANDAPLTLSELTPVAAPILPTPTTKALLPTKKINMYDATASQIASRVPKPASATHSARPKPKPAAGENIPSRITEGSIAGEIVTKTKQEPTVLAGDTPTSSLSPSKPISARAKSKPASDEATRLLYTDDAPTRLQPVSSAPAVDSMPLESPAAQDSAQKLEQIFNRARGPPAANEPTKTLPQKAKKTVASGGIQKPNVATSRPKPDLAPPRTTTASEAPRAPVASNPRPIAPAKVDAGNITTDADETGIAARLVMYGQQMIEAFPTAAAVDDAIIIDNPGPSNRTVMPAAARETEKAPVRDVSDGDNDLVVATDLDHPPEPRDASDSDNVVAPDADDRMVVDAEALEQSVVPRDDPLTLSQLSPRKGAPRGETMEGNEPLRDGEQGQRSGALSPMRPSAKRPASAAADAPMTRSKKGRVVAEGAPRGAGRGARPGPTRGRGGARVVSAPAQVRKQPARKTGNTRVQAQAPADPQPPQEPAASATAAPKDKDKLQRAPGVASSSSTSNASALNATVPLQFNFEVESRLGAHCDGDETAEMQPRPKNYSIPDFAALHASQAAQSALRRSQRAPPTVPVPLAFSTDARIRERARFDEQMREKERALEAAREVQRREREEAETRETKELRRRAIPKAHEVPEWYKHAPKTKRTDGGSQ
ncbi:hypothetical protein DFH09DRAFT_287712 [Mycena vulgaris]|nr:hypothetical protein DFH09DRAFT_287712 [Mycena vulgaris]